MSSASSSGDLVESSSSSGAPEPTRADRAAAAGDARFASSAASSTAGHRAARDGPPTKGKNDPRFEPLTTEEVNRVRETTNLYKDNLTRLQLEELLSEVRIDYSRTASIDSALHELRAVLTDKISEAEVDARAAVKPFPSICLHADAKERKMRVKVGPAAKVAVVGSYLLRTVARPALNVDLAVQMPAAMFHEKDYLNHRYADKRAVFLCHVAAALKDQPRFADGLAFAYLAGDRSKPVLVVRPGRDAKGKKCRFAVRIVPTLADNVFPPAKLVPWRNNNKAVDGPTPTYTNAIVEDTAMETHLAELHDLVSTSSGMAEAVILLKVWCRQRQFTAQQPDAVNPFILSMILLHLVRTRVIFKSMSSYQAVRLLMDYLTKTDLATDGICVGAAKQPADMKRFHEHFDVVCLDSSGRLNLAGRVSRHAFNELRHEAQLTAAQIESTRVDGIASAFLLPIEPTLKFDAHVHVDNWPPPPAVAAKSTSDRDELRRLLDVLERGLGPRSRLIGSRTTFAAGGEKQKKKAAAATAAAAADGTWPVDGPAPRSRTSVGLLFHADQVNKRVDTGPPADDKAKAAEFRAFWGDKSDLRRFKDGSIVEAVVWDPEQGFIPRQIITHVIGRHLPAETHSTFAIAQADSLVAADQNLEILRAFNKLDTAIRGLSDLPLSVMNIHAVDAALRAADVRRRDAVLRVVIQFEASARWPDDLRAIQKVKTAFYVQIGAMLRDECSIRSVPSTGSLDVHVDNFVFRVVVWHNREIQLAAAISPALEAAVRVEYDLAPRHATAIDAFRLLHPAYAPTVRLAKLWLNKHMMSAFITDEAMDLLVARIFTRPEPFDVPGSATVGIARFFDLISSFDFAAEVLVADLDDSLDVQKRVELEATVARNAAAKSGVRPAIVIASTYGDDESAFTRTTPTPEMLARVRTVARASLAYTKSLLAAGAGHDAWDRLLKPDMRHLDVILHIKVDEEEKRRQRKLEKAAKKAKKNRTDDAASAGPLAGDAGGEIGKTPGLYPGERLAGLLQEKYGHMAFIFHDALTNNAIGLVWRPAVFQPAAFRINSSAGTLPIKISDSGDIAVLPNMTELGRDLKRLGQGIVDSVEFQ